MWYCGSHTSKTAHPDDGYICSSRIVKAMILENSHEWVREIVALGSAQHMYDLETDILQTFDAKNDPRSFNGHNNNMKRYDKTGVKESEYTRKRKSIAHTGKKRPEHSVAMTGRIGYWSDKTRPDMVGENNPASKQYTIIPPNAEAYDIWAIKSYAQQQGWPMGTVWDLVHQKYIPKRGILKGYKIIVKQNGEN
jgi:hypothetical protein